MTSPSSLRVGRGTRGGAIHLREDEPPRLRTRARPELDDQAAGQERGAAIVDDEAAVAAGGAWRVIVAEATIDGRRGQVRQENREGRRVLGGDSGQPGGSHA